jgi:glucuronate isomerase
LESLGILRTDGGSVETDHRKIWQTVCDSWHLFRGTPTGMWLRDELADVFGITLKMNSQNAQAIYDAIAEKLTQPEFRPRALFERFNIEVLATTDAATDPLTHHKAIRESGWSGRVVPTFRPDGVLNLETRGWRKNIDLLSELSGIDVTDYKSFLKALRNRRTFFKSMGATATDHAALTANITLLSDHKANKIFQQALHAADPDPESTYFTGHMLLQMAQMSLDDGLVMQLHVGSYRDHNPYIADLFGRDKGADIPITSEFTQGLKPLLDAYGNETNLRIVLFNLDETTYSRELAPLAGHYPALRLGPPWWFFDSLNGMRRYFDQVMETAGLYNTAGFNDDTRAYPSIPARHDLWRRASVGWLAGLVVQGIIDEEDAHDMAYDMAYGLAKRTYKLDN